MTSEPTHFPSIKTDISDFCQEFAEVLEPFEDSIQTSLRDIQEKEVGDSLQRSLAGLSDVHHRVETLLNKVKEQQAYVIIFGPLKSGKSTLMNAISATYVSEVTSLPAYPCLVHVKYGEDYKFVVTRYNGEKAEYTENQSLKALVEESHRILADRIRQVEEGGEEFDPGVHYPDAIRRIDVEVRADNLREALTVLVDTPGLYSRMKFGYDLMTREFRNSAACAVFVVKTDNLFLEQVFDEFNELLDLFSRIFLIVNIDTNKRDLEPDGSLKPSLESESPQEIIQAFQSLVMSAPLRKAAEEGRLRIYPIDLLNAAAAALRQHKAAEPTGAFPDEAGEASGEAGTARDDAASAFADEEPPPGADQADSSITKHPEEPFSGFLQDLTDYLNSSDYLHEFMGDSLHRGKTLATEIQEIGSSEEMDRFREQQTQLRREVSEVAECLEATEALEKVDWAEMFGKLRSESNRGAREFAQKIQEDTERDVFERLDRWFDSDDSLAELRNACNELLESRRREIEKDSADRARRLVAEALDRMEMSRELRDALRRLNPNLEPALETAKDAVDRAEGSIPQCSLQVSSDAFKVKKGFWDWVLFRSQSAIRRRLFGPDDVADAPVPVAVKQKRFDESGKDAVRKGIGDQLSDMFPRAAEENSDKLLSVYFDALSGKLQEALNTSKSEYGAKKKELERRLEDNGRIQERFDTLATHSGSVVESINKLRETFHAVSWLDGETAADTDEEDESAPAADSGEAHSQPEREM